MTKESIKEGALLKAVNDALESEWNHDKTYCRIESIRKSPVGNCNWEVDTLSTGGRTLQYADQCSQLQSKVLKEFSEKYNVDWE
ncbi:hypothetical protein EUZ85_26365 [Hahella sp. KA22]|uniref:hypothetical protein n=1 Tax=Hahella sp. KA22 TaxID=1628392 RepID=UPI000FDDABCD|nr:hypothetical protein [Hahella sp. KA22]AZZ94052.1 hypothetical protein ENC22_23780 [Hahella sp. KA22]QAY57426.1 hypothetical protein EUZ85_26365 [Hahella sp. KA22]